MAINYHNVEESRWRKVKLENQMKIIFFEQN